MLKCGFQGFNLQILIVRLCVCVHVCVLEGKINILNKLHFKQTLQVTLMKMVVVKSLKTLPSAIL